MANEDEDWFQIIMPADAKAAFIADLAAAAREIGKAPPTPNEAEVSEAEARALKFDPVTVAAALVVLKFVATTAAGHLICKTLDKIVKERPTRAKIVVVDPRGLRYEVTAENLDKLLAALNPHSGP